MPTATAPWSAAPGRTPGRAARDPNLSRPAAATPLRGTARRVRTPRRGGKTSRRERIVGDVYTARDVRDVGGKGPAYRWLRHARRTTRVTRRRQSMSRPPGQRTNDSVSTATQLGTDATHTAQGDALVARPHTSRTHRDVAHRSATYPAPPVARFVRAATYLTPHASHPRYAAPRDSPPARRTHRPTPRNPCPAPTPPPRRPAPRPSAARAVPTPPEKPGRTRQRRPAPPPRALPQSSDVITCLTRV